MLLIYNFLSLIALVLYLPWLLFKKGPENRLSYLAERFGISEYKNTDIWIHAVSVGEVTASLTFLNRLKKEFPGIKIVFSTTTYTGQKIAREKFQAADRIMYIPWDNLLCVKRAVRLLKPKIFITVETELWPALFKALKNSGSHIILLNGRISPESFNGYKRIKFFMKRILSYVDFLYMQGKGDAERIILLGAEPEKVKVIGNFKFDADFNPAVKTEEWVSTLSGKIMVAGSTHKGEEEIVLDAFESIKHNISNVKLILAPRHPERFNEVEELLKNRKMNFVRRSDMGQGFYDIILLDTIGELPQVFSMADITFIGGSLLPFGGHNILEPAYWGSPIIFGPHMDNFPIAQEFLNDGAAVLVNNSGDITTAVLDIMEDAEKAKLMGQKAKAIVNNNTGAVEKALDLIRSLLGTA
jgi:3-deoxy-D-manno-octulosonic-acid transferase